MSKDNGKAMRLLYATPTLRSQGIEFGVFGCYGGGGGQNGNGKEDDGKPELGRTWWWNS